MKLSNSKNWQPCEAEHNFFKEILNTVKYPTLLFSPYFVKCRVLALWQRGKLPVSYIGILVQILTVPLRIQLPASMFGKAVEHGPGVWTPTTPVGDQDGVFWVVASAWSSLEGAAVWSRYKTGNSPHIPFSSFLLPSSLTSLLFSFTPFPSPSPSLCHSVFQVNKTFKKVKHLRVLLAWFECPK